MLAPYGHEAHPAGARAMDSLSYPPPLIERKQEGEMLSEHENKLLCEVGPGTPMGELLRRFWMPVLLSEELPEPDCDPVAVRILGEDLVGFRDAEGRLGVTSAYCGHRHAHLFWGRNEEPGLRCTSHGWN